MKRYAVPYVDGDREGTCIFDGFEVHPCVLVDTKGNPRRYDEPMPVNEFWCFEQCEEDDPHIACGHIPNAGLDCISDHKTRDEAAKAVAKLERIIENK